MDNTDTLSLLIKDIERFKKINKAKFNVYFLLIRYVIISSSFRTIFFYRVLNQQFVKNNKVSKTIWYINLIVNEIKIPYTAEIGSGLSIPHDKCIFINSDSKIGENATIQQGVTIGGNIFKTKNGRGSPIIGDNVLISAGAMILGPVTIGDNSIIGANAVVIKDIPKDSVAVGVPAKVVKKVDEPYIKILERFRDT